MNILLAVSGGIAACKAPKIITLLKEGDHEVRVIATENSLRFVSSLTLAALSGQRVLHDLWEGEGDWMMHHIRLPEWADLVLVAPASANLIGKVANGIADDLVSTTLNAVGTGADATCAVVYVPAMNPRMLRHAATQENLGRLESWGATILSPASGRLACGDSGEGRMPEPDDILRVLHEIGLLVSDGVA